MNFKARLSGLFPRHTFILFLCLVVFRYISYFLTKIVSENSYHYDFSFVLDDKIPFLPFFILFYVGAYVQWGFSYLYHASSSKENCFRLVFCDIVAASVCAICFVAIPTSIVRPEIQGNGIFENLTKLIYALDTPVNLFPSMHCLTSWMCFRSISLLKYPKKWYIILQLIFSIGVFASTVFIKQHFVVDIFAGIFVAEVAWHSYDMLHINKLFGKISEKIHSS